LLHRRNSLGHGLSGLDPSRLDRRAFLHRRRRGRKRLRAWRRRLPIVRNNPRRWPLDRQGRCRLIGSFRRRRNKEPRDRLRRVGLLRWRAAGGCVGARGLVDGLR
jgi:hypothetical protein